MTGTIKSMKTHLYNIPDTGNAIEASIKYVHGYTFNTDVTSDEGESCILKEIMSCKVAKF